MRILPHASIALLFALTAIAGCKSDDDKEKAAAPPIGKMAVDPAAAPVLAHEPPPGALSDDRGRVARARRILSQSLNATVEGTSRFESAPLYKLTLDIDYELFTYTARTELTYLNTEKDTLKELYFLVYPNSKELTQPGAKNLAVSDVTVDGAPGSAHLDGPLMRVPLTTPLKPGAEVAVSMNFRGNIVRLSAGSSDLKRMATEQIMQMIMGGDDHGGGEGYGIFAYGEDVVSMALWYPVLAAYDAERGWDLKEGTSVGDISYFDVANYEVTVNAPRDVTVIATGVETARSEADGWRKTTFQAGAVRELTVQMSKRYASTSAFVDGVKVTSWFLETDRKSGEAVLQYGKEALKLYNREFGPYPYTELDLVEAPLVGGAGGVEFPGLTTIAKMFYVPDKLPPGEKGEMLALLANNKFMKDTLEFVVAHEVAHQWWNAVVGSDSKRHPFVDEALANHSAILYFERVHGKDAAQMQIEMQLRLPFQISRLAGANDRPVDLPTDQYASMMEYAAIVYGKGALYFEEMRARFGDKSHLGFLKDYYAKHKCSIATQQDLSGGLIRSSRDPAVAQALSDRWLKQTHGDEDIGGIRMAAVARYLLGPEMLAGTVGQIFEALDHKGAAELAKLVQNFISEDGTIKQDIDYGQIVKLLVSMLGAEEDADMLSGLANLLGDNPDLLQSDSLRGTLKALAKGALGSDKKTDALIDVADALLKLLEED